LTVGTRLIFREGTTKGMGEVTKVFPLIINNENQSNSSNDSIEDIVQLPSKKSKTNETKQDNKIIIDKNEQQSGYLKCSSSSNLMNDIHPKIFDFKLAKKLAKKNKQGVHATTATVVSNSKANKTKLKTIIKKHDPSKSHNNA
jgi:hypothetical protein